MSKECGLCGDGRGDGYTCAQSRESLLEQLLESSGREALVLEVIRRTRELMAEEGDRPQEAFEELCKRTVRRIRCRTALLGACRDLSIAAQFGGEPQEQRAPPG